MTPKHMQTNSRDAQKHNTPFLEEMSLASSSLRLARESASSSARGRALSCGAEWLCWRLGSPKVWVPASRRATQHRQTRADCAYLLTMTLMAFVSGLSLPVARDLYLQKEQRWSAGPRLGAGRRRGAPNSLYTGQPARHTHIDLQSSETQREREERV